jgi:hypothetical protein
MQRRVCRKFNKAGKGGKRQLDGSSHRENHNTFVTEIDEATEIDEEWIEWDALDHYDLETHPDPQQQMNEDSLACFEQLDVERQKDWKDQSQFSLFAHSSSSDSDTAPITPTGYLRAVVAPLNWQQHLLGEREEVHRTEIQYAHAQLAKQALVLLQTSQLPAKGRRNCLEQPGQMQHSKHSKYRDFELLRDVVNAGRLLGGAFPLDRATFDTPAGPVGNILQLAARALEEKEWRQNYDNHLCITRAEAMGLTPKEVKEIDFMVEDDERRMYGEMRGDQGLAMQPQV